jgi:hypothetical protein
MAAQNLKAGKFFIRVFIPALSPRRLTFRLFCLDSGDAGIRRWRVHRGILREKARWRKAEPSLDEQAYVIFAYTADAGAAKL